VSTLLTRFFPAPQSLVVPSAGLDFSDATMRYVELREGHQGILPHRYGESPIPQGIIQAGRIVDAKAFGVFLREIKAKHNLKYVRVSIPESQVYSFTLPLDIQAATDVRSAIELVIEDNIPLKSI